jgi:hypothetical protein
MYEANFQEIILRLHLHFEIDIDIKQKRTAGIEMKHNGYDYMVNY